MDSHLGAAFAMLKARAAIPMDTLQNYNRSKRALCFRYPIRASGMSKPLTPKQVARAIDVSESSVKRWPTPNARH